jgi:zinc protease
VSRALAPAFAALLAVGCAFGAHKPAWEQPPPPPRDAPVVAADALHRAVLPNGLRVLVLEDHRLPRAAIGVTVRRGAALEAPEEAGLAAFTAELMERGAGDRDALELAAVVDRIGASLAVGAGWDETTAAVSGLARDLDTLFEVLADVVLRPRFDPGEAERVRAETLAALEKEKDDPASLRSTAFAAALYPGHRFGIPTRGAPETVAGLGAGGARAFHARVFVPSNAIFYATGDLDLAAVLERVEAAFGSWTGGPAPEPGPPAPARSPEARSIVIVDRPDLGQVQIAVGHEGLARSDERRLTASLVSRVLGAGGFSSRLMNRVRSEEGLTYSVGAGFALRRQPGPFYIATFTRVPEVRRVVDILLEEMERIRSEPPVGIELSNAQSQSTGGFALSLETSAAVAQSMVDLDVHGLPEDSLDTFRGRIRAIREADVARVAAEVIHPERTLIVVVGPAEELRGQLEDLGPIEVVTP